MPPAPSSIGCDVNFHAKGGSAGQCRRLGAPAVPWLIELKAVSLSGLGAADLLKGPMTAFFASRQCPGSGIRAAIAWALQQARDRCTVVGGFYCPLAQSKLRLLLEGKGTAVVVLARSAAAATLPSTWHAALGTDRMAVVSRSSSAQGLTEQGADDRNNFAARLADRTARSRLTPALRWQIRPRRP